MNILITGGSSGIGAALAIRLARDKNRIMITGRSEERLKQVSNSISDLGSACEYITGDVGKTEDVKKIVSKAMGFMGSIDLMIINAGTGAFKLIEEMSDDDYDLQFSTNSRAVFLFLREVLPSMKLRKTGQIIVTSSNLGFAGTARGSIYAATKHAVQGIVTSVRQELVGTGVKLGTVNPGSVDTEWFPNHDSEIPNPKRLSVEEVVDAFMMIINQGSRSNIDHILLHPLNS